MGKTSSRRAIKRAILLPCMRQRAVIALQETRGNYVDMQFFAGSTPHPRIAFHSVRRMNLQNAGGVANLIPRDKCELSLLAAHRPRRNFRPVVRGRVAGLRDMGGEQRHETASFNVHNH
eukprot:4081084-Pyramimonas_sp.AAC.1